LNFRLHPLALVASLGLAGAQVAAQVLPAVPGPLTLEADEVRGRPDLEVEAIGNVLLRREDVTLRTDLLRYDNATDRASARGNVRVDTARGDWFAGSEVSLVLGRFEGWFLDPEYYFSRTLAGGRAQRIDFIDADRARLTGADYTSCDRSGRGMPDWVLSTRRVRLDFEANEGVAEGAVLRFLGVPILAAPVLSFPLTADRKTGWLPPSINLDNKSGLEVAVPWYWNIAPQRDATLTPVLYSRRGFGLGTQVRYLEPRHEGEVDWNWLPVDRVAERARSAIQWRQRGTTDWLGGLRWHHEGYRVSDDDYWKDFSRTLRPLTPRLLPLGGSLERDVALPGLPNLPTTAYARAVWWQVLQDTDPQARIVAPYHRAPQLGWRGLGTPWGGGAEIGFEAEYNRFELAGDSAATTEPRPEGDRVHLLASASRRFGSDAAWLTPRLLLNAASYRTDTPMADGRRSASRAIPTFSLDSGLLFERAALWRGRAMTQTLEPRLLYVNTPYRDQDALPLFDTAPKDFNPVSLFSENAFSGIDRVSDAHQLTAGVTTRLFDATNGEEQARLGLAQRWLLRDQRVTPDGTPLTQRFSDLFLTGGAKLSQRWSFDGGLQYSLENDRPVRSVFGARYSPGPLRTLSATYRLTRGASEQLDVGWQWPVYRAEPAAAGASASGCRGTLYTVGRVNYSMKDSRITDSLAGLEYDAGCWIARVVAERVSTGRSEANTRLMLQLELVGLSRLGSNPLNALKDNIPGYTLLREDRLDPPVRSYTRD
jgi:LPS-assembly protein